jgi:lipopolysaccharide/colanic/teichoic acid biosynthesis glycosyltransferase
MYAAVKRLIDVVVSLLALPFLVLFAVVVGPLIRREDRGPILHSAPRFGRGGRIFRMHKFRSMQVNAPDLRNTDGSTYNGPDDSRVTAIGRFLRKTSLDELPQFLNVVTGEMSLVGPRPNLATRTYDQLSAVEQYRLRVRPGITGLAQASARNAISLDEQYELDCRYINRMSLGLDLRILALTVSTVLRGRSLHRNRL